MHYEQGSWQELCYYLNEKDTAVFIASPNEHIFYKKSVWSESSQEKFRKRFLLSKSLNNYWHTDNFTANNAEGKNRLYALPNHFYFYGNEKGNIAIDPVLYVQTSTGIPNASSLQFNGRGVAMQGSLNNRYNEPRVSFYTRMLETQAYLPAYAKMFADSFGVIPGQGWWKPFKTNGSDFVYATGYVNMALLNSAKDKTHIVMQAGHEAVQVGPGYRSLLLGGMGNPFGYVRINTRIGMFRYQNLYASLNGFLPLTGNTLLPKKYLAMHRGELSLGKKKNLQLGFSEIIVHSRQNGYGGFDPEYLNPIIFYRSLEANMGSADNAFMSLDANWNLKGLRLYGQFLIDEWKLSYVKKGNWWGNKSGYQFGIMATPEFTGIKGLLCQLEYNAVRPYTYSHYDILNSYSHYNQALAHPLESNFREGVLKIDYLPNNDARWRFSAIAMYAVKGFDSSLNTGNYGSNLRRDNDTRIRDFDVKMLQGVKGNIFNVMLEAHYMFAHNWALFVKYQYRKQTAYFKTDNSLIFLGLKVNFDRKEILY